MKKITVFIILLSLSGISQSFGRQPVNITVGDENPPFMYTNGDKVVGLYPALIESVFQRMQIPVDIKALPWKRALRNADEGKTGIGGIYKTADREKKYDYSNEIFQEEIVLFVLKGKAFPYNSLTDLKGKKIGVIRGWSYGDAFDAYRKDNLFMAEETGSDEQNFSKLLLGRIDCLIAIKESGQSLQDKDIFKGKIIQIHPHIIVNPTYLIFSKTANQTGLLSRFNTVLGEMKAKGEYDQLIHSFFLKQ